MIAGINIVPDGRQLTGREAKNSAAAQVTLHHEVVARREPIDRHLVAVDDDIDDLRPGGEMVSKVRTELGAVPGGQHGRCDGQPETGEGKNRDRVPTEPRSMTECIK